VPFLFIPRNEATTDLGGEAPEISRLRLGVSSVGHPDQTRTIAAGPFSTGPSVSAEVTSTSDRNPPRDY
jgi:hypothetical protein